jgi:hypothetical protein
VNRELVGASLDVSGLFPTVAQIADGAAPAGDEVGQVVMTQMAPRAVVGLRVPGDHVTASIDQLLVGVHHVVVEVSCEVVDEGADGVRMDHVVVITDRDQRAAGGIETVVRGGGDPAVLDPTDQPTVVGEIGPLVQEIDDTSVGRRIVDHDAFPVRRRLGGDGIELCDQRRVRRVVHRQPDRHRGDPGAGAFEGPSWHAEMLPMPHDGAGEPHRSLCGTAALPTLAVMSPTRVDVVVLTFAAAPGMLEDAVRSVLDRSHAASAGTERSVRVWIVDNGAHAADRLAAATWRDQPMVDAVRLIVSADNRGYAAGMNVGLDAAVEAGADVVVLLNDDVVVADGWLEPLLAEFDDVEVGAVQPLLVTPGGATINSAGVDIDRFGAGNDRMMSEPVVSAPEPVDIEVFTGGAVATIRFTPATFAVSTDICAEATMGNLPPGT